MSSEALAVFLGCELSRAVTVYGPFGTVGTENVQVNAPWNDVVVHTLALSEESVTVTAEYSPNPVPLTVTRLPGNALELDSESVGPIE